jgi:hypothetical protein
MFGVSAADVLRVIKAFEHDELTPSDLETIGFTVLASDWLQVTDLPESKGVFDVLHNWAVPFGDLPVAKSSSLIWRSWLRAAAPPTPR